MASRQVLTLGLALALAVATLLYWRANLQLEEVRQSKEALGRRLADSRRERESVQHKLEQTNSKLERVFLAGEESEKRLQELDEQVQGERGKLVRLAVW